MAFLKFLLYFFLVIFIIRILWRLFGPYVLRWTLTRLARRMEEQAARQQNAYQRQYDPNYREEIQLNPNLKVRVPRSKDPDRDQRRHDDAESVDFEEV